MKIVEEVGLITCERGVVGQRARLLILVECTGDLVPKTSTQKRKRCKSRFRKKKWKIEKHGREQGEEKEREQTITQTHDTWMG